MWQSRFVAEIAITSLYAHAMKSVTYFMDHDFVSSHRGNQIRIFLIWFKFNVNRFVCCDLNWVHGRSVINIYLGNILYWFMFWFYDFANGRNQSSQPQRIDKKLIWIIWFLWENQSIVFIRIRSFPQILVFRYEKLICCKSFMLTSFVCINHFLPTMDLCRTTIAQKNEIK